MEEESLPSEQTEQVDPVEDLIKALNKERKSHIARASRLSELSMVTYNLLKSNSSGGKFSDISEEISPQTSSSRTSPGQESKPPIKQMDCHSSPDKKSSSLAIQYLKDYLSFQKKGYSLAQEDYIQSYQMTESSGNSDDDILPVVLKMDPNASNKPMPYIGAKRVPVWAEQQNKMRAQLCK